TNPGKTFFWVIADDQIVYGGRILNRTYNLSAQQVTITGAGFHGYWAQRLQAKDYTAFIQTYSGSYVYAWANATPTLPGVGVPAPLVAWQLLRDAAAVTGSLPNLTVPAHGTGAGSNS